MKTYRVLVFLFLLGAGQDIHARDIPAWPYERLFNEADAVILADAISNHDTTDVSDPKGYIGVDTVLQVKHVMKGKIETKNITVLHFRHDPHHAFADGMLVVHFRLTGGYLRGEFLPDNKKMMPIQVKESLPQPEYMLFLKRRADGRYEPVTGQDDAALSVREVAQPSSAIWYYE
jgi:hypothetical protein